MIDGAADKSPGPSGPLGVLKQLIDGDAPSNAAVLASPEMADDPVLQSLIEGADEFAAMGLMTPRSSQRCAYLTVSNGHVDRQYVQRYYNLKWLC